MNYFEKKQWIRLGICAVVVLAITLLVSGLIGDNLKYNLKEEPKQVSGDGFQYSSEQKTNFSVIRVYANAEDGKITECSIASEGENDYLTNEIRDEWAKAIVEAGNADTDAITGATLTFSAEAVTNAVNDILAQAGGGESNQVKETEKDGQTQPTEGTSENIPEGKQVSDVSVDDSRVLYGSYTAKRETDFSIIRVTADTKDGKITACKITSEGKQEGSDFMTDQIREEWAKAIVENGTAETDAITGATLKYSSAAVIDAVKEILEQIK
jgi:uncharacterized protein with FMN-binding domain